MYRYRAFGLRLSSDVRLDELEEDLAPEQEPDLRITKADVGYHLLPIGGPPHFDFEDPAGVLMAWPGAAAVRIKGTGSIEIQPFPGVPENYLAFPLLGPAMGWTLHMRGLMVLHASTVVHHGVAVTFLGDKTAGKSTTATAFLAAGARLLTDDLLALRFDDEMQCLAMPAFGQFKLDAKGPGAPQAIEAQKLPLVMEGFEKRQYRISNACSDPLPPGLLFVLERGGDAPEITWSDEAEALSALIRYAYNNRFVQAPVEQQQRARHFQQAAALMAQARIGRLRIPHALDRLPEVVSLVESTIAGARN